MNNNVRVFPRRIAIKTSEIKIDVFPGTVVIIRQRRQNLLPCKLVVWPAKDKAKQPDITLRVD